MPRSVGKIYSQRRIAVTMMALWLIAISSLETRTSFRVILIRNSMIKKSKKSGLKSGNGPAEKNTSRIQEITMSMTLDPIAR